MVDVEATNGDTFLGGRDFDDILINVCLEQFKNIHGIDLKAPGNENKEALQRMREACEAAKIELSSSPNTEIRVRQLAGGKDFLKRVTREEFE